jgi:hypothetical protein
MSKKKSIEQLLNASLKAREARDKAYANYLKLNDKYELTIGNIAEGTYVLSYNGKLYSINKKEDRYNKMICTEVKNSFEV